MNLSPKIVETGRREWVKESNGCGKSIYIYKEGEGFQVNKLHTRRRRKRRRRRRRKRRRRRRVSVGGFLTQVRRKKKAKRKRMREAEGYIPI